MVTTPHCLSFTSGCTWQAILAWVLLAVPLLATSAGCTSAAMTIPLLAVPLLTTSAAMAVPLLAVLDLLYVCCNCKGGRLKIGLTIIIPEQFTVKIHPALFGGEGANKWRNTFQRLRPEEFSSGRRYLRGKLLIFQKGGEGGGRGVEGGEEMADVNRFTFAHPVLFGNPGRRCRTSEGPKSPDISAKNSAFSREGRGGGGKERGKGNHYSNISNASVFV